MNYLLVVGLQLFDVPKQLRKVLFSDQGILNSGCIVCYPVNLGIIFTRGLILNGGFSLSEKVHVDVFRNGDEPEKVARSIKIMKIKHAVITSVDRDDLKDMGSIIWAETVKAIRRMNPETTLETLIPDFQGVERNLDRIIEVNPEVVSHNMETVKRLTREVRIQARYERSLEVLDYLKKQGIRRTKSGIMLGLGEQEEEVIQTLKDLRSVDLDIVTIGQYLQPSKKHLPVKEFITPEQFKKYETIGLELGFRHVESGALVRSSYKAQKHLL